MARADDSAAIADNSVSHPLAAAAQERFLRLAFTAADLLMELGADGTIHYATGAFNTHFGAPAARFLGGNISRLIAPADRAALAASLAEAVARGRSAPVVLHLANAVRAPLTFAALAADGAPGGLSVTLGRPAAGPRAAGEVLDDPATFALEAEMRLATGASASLALIELGEQGPGASGDAERAAWHHAVGGALARAPELGAAPLVGALAPGRFGVIGPGTADLEALCRRLETLTGVDGVPGGARGTGMRLAAGDLGAVRAMRALRSALRSFAGGGVAGLAKAGFARGLEGFLEEAGQRATAIQRTIAGRHFRLAFQPVVSLADRKVRHYEALLRPAPMADTPPTSTQEFVTFAEAVGLSEELDTAVMEEALAVLREAPGVALAVNLSGLSLQDAAFRERLLAQVRRAALPRGRLLVELTETAEIENVAAAKGTLAALREAGVPVCLDDFGSGAAAFRYLRDFRVDFIKIDGAYLRAALHNPRARAMLGSMISLAQDTSAEVVVEMVETEEQEALCRAIGAHLGQGWLYGKPGRLPGTLGR